MRAHKNRRDDPSTEKSNQSSCGNVSRLKDGVIVDSYVLLHCSRRYQSQLAIFGLQCSWRSWWCSWWGMSSWKYPTSSRYLYTYFEPRLARVGTLGSTQTQIEWNWKNRKKFNMVCLGLVVQGVSQNVPWDLVPEAWPTSVPPVMVMGQPEARLRTMIPDKMKISLTGLVRGLDAVIRLRTSRTINALGVDAVQRSAGGAGAVGAATRRTNRNSSAVQNGDGLGVRVGASISHGNHCCENKASREDLHGRVVQIKMNYYEISFSIPLVP